MNLINNWTRISLCDRVFYLADGTTVNNAAETLTFSNQSTAGVMWSDGVLYTGTITFLKRNASVQEDLKHTEEQASNMMINLLKQSQPTLHRHVINFLSNHPDKLDDIPSNLDTHATWLLASNIFEEHDAGNLYCGELKGELTRLLGRKIAIELAGYVEGHIVTV